MFSLLHTAHSTVSIHTLILGVVFSAVQLLYTSLDRDWDSFVRKAKCFSFFAKSLLALEATSVIDTHSHSKTPSGAARLTDYYHLSLMNTWTFVI